MDPRAVDAWANTLRQAPRAVLWLQRYDGHELAAANLALELAARGVPPARLAWSSQAPWIEHVWRKTAADVALDTLAKGGHTVAADALWAGVPLVTVPGAAHLATRRAAASLLRGLGEELTVAPSLKAYENLASRLGRDPLLLAALRRRLGRARLTAPVFDTTLWAENMAAGLEDAWEASKVAGTKAHVVVAARAARSPVVPRSALDRAEAEAEEAAAAAAAAAPPVLLHIGAGAFRRPGWTPVDADPAVLGDGGVVSPMHRLEVASGSVTAIYASHVLEHAYHSPGAAGKGGGHTGAVLAEWHRVLRHGGALYVSVPDLQVLGRLVSEAPRAAGGAGALSLAERAFLAAVLYGGQNDEWNVHRAGFDEQLLARALSEAGFCRVRRVRAFGLFNDTSLAAFKGVPVSLSVVAEACGKAGDRVDVRFGEEAKGRGQEGFVEMSFSGAG